MPTLLCAVCNGMVALCHTAQFLAHRQRRHPSNTPCRHPQQAFHNPLRLEWTATPAFQAVRVARWPTMPEKQYIQCGVSSIGGSTIRFSLAVAIASFNGLCAGTFSRRHCKSVPLTPIPRPLAHQHFQHKGNQTCTCPSLWAQVHSLHQTFLGPSTLCLRPTQQSDKKQQADDNRSDNRITQQSDDNQMAINQSHHNQIIIR